MYDLPQQALRNVVLLSFALFDELGHVTTFTKLHNNVNMLLFLVNDPVIVFNNVMMIDFS